MTTLDTRKDSLPMIAVTFEEAPIPAPARAVIDGVYSDARDVPARNPHRIPVWVSAFVLLGTIPAQLIYVDGTDLEKGGALFALLIAVVWHVGAQLRFHARAKAGDR